MAIDLEPDMVAAGREEAAHRGIGNVIWHVGRAEDAMLAPGSVDLITIGEAFHRLDQQTLVAKVSVWLKPGGCIAILGSDGVLAGSAPWKARLSAEARLWFPSGSAQGRPGAQLGADGSERVLQRAGFAEVQSHTFVVPRDWSFDEIVGCLRSMSVRSERGLGEQSHAFKESLSKILGGGSACVSHDRLCWSYMLGRRPLRSHRT
jgi:SAM-dependent methyltransferase